MIKNKITLSIALLWVLLLIIVSDFTPLFKWILFVIVPFMIFPLLEYEELKSPKEQRISKTPLSNNWKYKNYNDVEIYLNEEKSHLKISDTYNRKLVVLLFFGWRIEDDSDLENIIMKYDDNTKTINLKESSN